MQIEIKKITKKGRFYYLEICPPVQGDQHSECTHAAFDANYLVNNDAEKSKANALGVIKLHPDTMAEFSLFQGMEFCSEKLDEINKHSEFRTAWDSALRMLSVRAHCINELRKKLIKKNFSSETVLRVMNECARLGLVDDAKFAKAYIEELISGGKGRRVIRKKLFCRGVPNELIDRLMEDSFSEDDELAAAAVAIRKKTPSLKREPDPRKRREKLFRYMAGKGFSYDTITSVLDDSDILK